MTKEEIIKTLDQVKTIVKNLEKEVENLGAEPEGKEENLEEDQDEDVHSLNSIPKNKLDKVP